MMNVKNWKENFTAELSEDSDANDYYYSWISMTTENEKYDSIEDLFKKVLDMSVCNKTKVKIKTFDGAIFIQRIDD